MTDFLLELLQNNFNTSICLDEEYALMFINSSTINTWNDNIAGLWERAKWKIFVDGVSNVLHGFCIEKGIAPDFITGDFDSINPEIRDYFKYKGSKMIYTPNQNKVDFQKAVEFVELDLNKEKTIKLVVVIGFQGGRLDHVFGNLAALHSFINLSFPVICLSSLNSTLFILSIGKYEIYLDEKFNQRDKHCGLIPYKGPVSSVTTQGLRWNLNNNEMSFDTLVSTSNVLDSATITIETDGPLLFICEVDLDLF